jgi:hypothetical protein
MSTTIRARSWTEFEEILQSYFELPGSRRSEFLFRGHGDVAWKLQPTLERFLGARGIDLARQNTVAERLNAEFIAQAAAFLPEESVPGDPMTIELLARHFGVPSKLLDWTRSPYVAVYFAATTGDRSADCCIHVLDREAAFGDKSLDERVQLIELPEYSLFNARATEQDAVAIRLEDVGLKLDSALAHALSKIEIASAARNEILTRLASMRITARTLFRSADHAAETAMRRVEMEFSA